MSRDRKVPCNYVQAEKTFVNIYKQKNNFQMYTGRKALCRCVQAENPFANVYRLPCSNTTVQCKSNLKQEQEQSKNRTLTSIQNVPSSTGRHFFLKTAKSYHPTSNSGLPWFTLNSHCWHKMVQANLSLLQMVQLR